jgi:DedD protein
VLVGIGIVGFPLLFETQPRPIAVDIPIEIPSRERVAPLKLPAPKAATPAPPRVTGAVTAEPAAEASSAAVQVEASPPAASAAAPRAERAASTPVAVARSAASAAEPSRDAQRAQALLDGKPTATPSAEPAATVASEPKTPRFVVQAGAYTDAATLREARQKVEKLGLKTYTQVVETDSGSRTRVRVGPYDTREEAERVAARIKGSGLAANILSL